jgi:hypothetical protein
MRENNQVWGHKQGVDCQNGDNKVPDLTEGALRINEIPFEFGLSIDDQVVTVLVLVNVVNHHFFEVDLRHLLKPNLKSELTIVTSSFAPEISNSLFLLSFRHISVIGPIDVIALVKVSFWI